jgi:two-component system cell cycle sensor histidine kinase/response regulator CckA
LRVAISASPGANAWPNSGKQKMTDDLQNTVWKREPLRIILPSLLSIVLFTLVIFFFVLPDLKGHIMDGKKEMIRETAQMAWDTMAFLNEKEEKGQLSREEAQGQAIEHIQSMFYGRRLKYCFWINDMSGGMIIRPYRVDLEDQNVSEITDPTGSRFFQDFIDTVKKQGEGFVDYLWQWNDGPSDLVPRISFVKGFRPWGWVVGTGVYLEDMKSQVAAMTRELSFISLGILALSSLLFLYIIRQGLKINENRMRADRALRESEERFRKLAEDAPFGLSIMNAEGAFDYFNPKFIEIFQYTTEDVPDRDAWLKAAFPDTGYREKGISTWEQDLDRSERENRIIERTLWVRCKDGQHRSIHLRNVSLPDGAQFTTYEDVTAKAKADEMLRESERRFRKLYEESKKGEELYRSLIHSSADAIIIYDLEGKALYVSPAFTQIFGWTAEEVKGKRIPFLPDSESQATMTIIKGLVMEGKPCHGFETKRLTKEGSLLDVSISASRYDDHQGQPAGILVIIRDISETKRLQAQLQQAQKMEAIGTLAGGIAHDFNNLLMGIQGNVSLVLMEHGENAPGLERLNKIEQQVQSGAKLTSQLLGYARQGRYELKPIDLNSVVEETSETFGRTKKQITIVRELAGDLFAIEADLNQIEQVLFNVYVNAWQAMPSGGTLSLKTRNTDHEEMEGKVYTPKPGKYVMLTVTDTGTGMDAEVMERIFEPFFTTKEMGHGTGLGLASAYGIIKGHAGYIDVESKKGGGTAFKIYLPASPEAVSRSKSAPEKIGKGNETVLLVDDEEIILRIGEELLEVLGYRTYGAKDGKQALELYKEHHDEIDLVLLDMVMPDMGGGQTFNLLKEIDPNVKVLLSSGYSLNGEAKEIFDRGCKGFIQKPFRLKELSGAIRKILDEADL